MLASSGHEAAPDRPETQDPGPPTVPQAGLVQFFRCLAVMVSAGMPVHDGLGHLARATEPPLGPVLESVTGQIAEGSTLSRALASYPKIFPSMAVHLMEIAEATGKMSYCLNSLADYMEKNQALRRRMISALAYPCMLLILTLFMASFMLFVVFPKQQQTFQELGTELPWISRLLMGVVPVISNPLFIGASLGLGLTLFLGRTPLLWYWKNRWQFPFDRWILTTPVAGPLVRKAGTGQILEAMSTLLEAGCGLNQTSRAAELGLNLELRRRYLDFLSRLQDGQSLPEAVEGSECFPPTVVHMFAVAEEHGSLGSLARRCANLYNEEVEWAFLTFASLAEPLALAIMGVVMGVVMLATFLPMVSLVQRL